MAAKAEKSIKQTIRRGQLRQIVPLADSTIYEMEQRSDVPRRFALSTRCVVWDLGEVEAWLARADGPRRAPRRGARLTRTSASAEAAPSKRRVRNQHRHRRRNENREMFSSRHPGVDDIRPLLHHVPPLRFVFRLVVDAARRPAVLMR